MATVTIQVVAGGDTMTRTRTVSGPHLVRFIAALRVALGIGATPTDVQVLEVWADRVFDNGRAITRGIEVSTASNAITDIDFTP